MNISIRPAVAEDASALSVLSMRSKQSNGYDDAFMQACRDELTVTKADIRSADWWVAELNDAGGGEKSLCGCVCLVGAGEQSAEVHAFFVDPDCQRQGVGRRLWKTLLQRARLLSVEKITLDSDPNAVAFYQALGFKVVGEKPSGSIAGRMLPHMAITL